MKSQFIYTLLIIWGALEVVIFSGLIFGWASLVYIFKLEKYFDYCDDHHGQFSEKPHNSSISDSYKGNMNSTIESSTRSISESMTILFDDIVNKDDSPALDLLTGSCAAQQNAQFNLVYTLAVAINGLTTFFNGWMLDKYGTCLIRVCGM